MGTLEASLPSDREIQFKRVFNAPRELVWRAHTEPELIRQWLFGPEGWSMPVCEMDLRVGGKYRYQWRRGDGRTMDMGGVIRELAPPQRIVTTELFDKDWTGGETLVAHDFSEQNGKTTLTMTLLYTSPAARDGALKSPMSIGMEAGYARLDEIMKSQLT